MMVKSGPTYLIFMNTNAVFRPSDATVSCYMRCYR
jgi:hypothetical protein